MTTLSYKTLLTTAGEAAFASASRGIPLQLTYISVGDGGGTAYTPDGTETSLKGPVWRGAVHRAVSVPGHPDQLLVEGIVPASEGGWTVREVGLLDGRSRLLAIASYPETHKPTPQQGADTEIVIQLILKVANAASVTLTLDSSAAFATASALTDAIKDHGDTRDHPPASTSARGLVELATTDETEEGTDTQRATTPEGVKAHVDGALQTLEASLSDLSSTSMTGAGVVSAISSGVKTHAASRDHPAASTTEIGLVELATTAETRRGLDTQRATTPAAVKTVRDRVLSAALATHAASRFHPPANTAERGMVELATTDETTSGTSTSHAVTPAGVKAVADALSTAASQARSRNLASAKSYARALDSTHASASGHPAATTSRKGPVELATSAETTSGRSASLAVTPAGLKTTMTARLASLYSVPTGAIMAHASATAPSGWLLCDGAIFNSRTYSSLYGVIGTRFGGTSTSPKLPDLRKKFVMGDGSDTSVGDTGGSASHTHTTTVGAHTLTIAQIPRHRHGSGIERGGSVQSATSLRGVGTGIHTDGYQTAFTGGSASHTHTGSASSASSLPPYVVLAYIIRT